MPKFLSLFLLCAGFLPLFQLGGSEASVISNDDPAKVHAVLENSLLRAEFSAVGGKLISLKDKRNNIELSNADGALRDQLCPGALQPFPDCTYAVKAEQDKAKGAKLILTASPVKEREYVLLRKVISLDENSAILQVQVEVQNQLESMSDMSLGYWSHNFFGVAEKPSYYIVPQANGIKKQLPDKNNTLQYNFDRKVIRNWAAIYTPEVKAGVVLLADYPEIEMIYPWYCRGSHMSLDTLEMRTWTKIISKGKSISWNLAVGVPSLLTTLDGAGMSGCGSISSDHGKISIALYGFSDREGSAELLLNGKVRETGSVTVTAGNIAEYSFKTVAQGEAIQVILRDQNGKYLFDLLRGSLDGQFQFPPMGTRNEAQSLEKESWHLNVSGSFQTPHWQWSTQKLPGRTLFLIPTDGIRDAVEFIQRQPMDYDAPTVFPTGYNMSWKTAVHFDPGCEATGTDKVISFLNRPYSAIVIGSGLLYRVQWKDYPPDVQEKILKQVESGALLLYINPIGFENSRLHFENFSLPHTVNAEAAPYFSEAQFQQANYGKGKVISVKFPVPAFMAPLCNWRSRNFQQLVCDHRFQEYQFAIFAKIIRDVLQKEKVFTQISLDPAGAEIEASAPAEVEIELFDRYSDSIEKRKVALVPGKNRIPLHLRDGKNYLHVRSANGDFGFALFKKGPQSIQSVSMKESFKKGEPVSGSVKAVSDVTIQIAIVDNEGRFLYQSSGSDFSWDQSLATGNHHQLVVEAWRDGRLVDRRKKDFYLPEQLNVFQNFPSLVWLGDDQFPEYSYLYRNEISRRFGFNYLYGASYSAASPELLRFANSEIGMNRHEPGNFHAPLAALYDPRYLKTHDKKYLTRKWCPSDPGNCRASYIPDLKRVSSYCTRTLFQLGDEMSLTAYGTAADFCFCDYCMKKFRAEMKKKYGTLERLNSEWKSNFKDWDSVLPQTYTEAMTQESPAAFYDFRAFMDQVFIGKLCTTRNDIRTLFPNALVGPTGVSSEPGIYGGNLNFWEMSTFDCGSYYKTPRIPASFRRDERIIMQYFGYSATENYNRFHIWESLLVGCRGINSWYDPIFILPDLRPSEVRKYYSDLLWEIRDGVGEILYHTPKYVNQVAILHSQRAMIANYLKTDKSPYYEKELSFACALEDAGLAYRFIAPEEIEGGILKDFQALILPESSAMSDQEIEAVRNFCRNGGTVIADYDCATLTANGNLRSPAALDDMFGVKNGLRRLRKVERHNLKEVFIEQVISGIQPTNGKALAFAETRRGEVPLAITNRYGKGRTVMLNFVPVYEQQRGNRDGFAQFLYDLIALPSLAKSDAKRPVMHSYFRSKDQLTVAMLPIPTAKNWENLPRQTVVQSAFESTVHFSKSGYVYDLRKKLYLGYGQDFKVRMIPGDAVILSWSKEKPEFSVPPISTVETGKTTEFSVKVLSGGRRFILMRIYRPDGSEELWARQMHNGEKEIRFAIPMALNAVKGKYRIMLDDAATGMHFEQTVDLVR